MFQDLHQLIHTLTTKEFNKLDYFIKLDSERDLNYASLFRCLYDMEEDYDDDLISTFCDEHGTTRESLRVTSYELEKKIMLYLRDPKARPDPVWTIECLLKDARIFERKGLYKLAEKKLDSALKIAQDNHLPGLEYKIHMAYSTLLQRLNDGRQIDKIVEKYNEAMLAWQRYLTSQATIQINHETVHIWLTDKRDTSSLEGRIDLEENSIPQELSFFAQLRYAQTRQLLSMIANNKDAGIKWQTEARKIFLDHKILQKSFLFEYIVTTANYLNAVFMKGSWELLLEAVDDLKQITTEDPQLDCLLSAVIHQYQLNYWVNHGNDLTSVKEEQLDDVIEFLETFETQIAIGKYTAIVDALASIFLLLNKHELARHWWRKIKVGHANDLQPLTQRKAILIDLINDYADKTYERVALSGRVESTRKKLAKITIPDPPAPEADEGKPKKKFTLFEHERITIFYLRKLVKLAPWESQKEIELLKDFHKSLKEHEKELEESEAKVKFEENIRTCHLILHWLEKQLNKFGEHDTDS